MTTEYTQCNCPRQPIRLVCKKGVFFMTKVWGRMQAVKLFLQSRLFAVSLLFVVLAFVVYRISTMTNAVYLVGETGRSLRYTTQDDLSRLLPGTWNKPLRGTGRTV